MFWGQTKGQVQFRVRLQTCSLRIQYCENFVVPFQKNLWPCFEFVISLDATNRISFEVWPCNLAWTNSESPPGSRNRPIFWPFLSRNKSEPIQANTNESLTSVEFLQPFRQKLSWFREFERSIKSKFQKMMERLKKDHKQQRNEPEIELDFTPAKTRKTPELLRVNSNRFWPDMLAVRKCCRQKLEKLDPKKVSMKPTRNPRQTWSENRNKTIPQLERSWKILLEPLGLLS